MSVGDGFAVRSPVFRARFGCGPNGEIRIGNNVFVNLGVTLYASERISIGDHTLIGDQCVIYDTDFHQVHPGSEPRVSPITIGRNVWIGRGAFILPGVMIGDHAVVAAASVVTKDVPPRTVVGGSPAHEISTFDAEDSWVRH
jgi:acetyltransferase-like isoleucine patch superfamily enzyme